MATKRPHRVRTSDQVLLSWFKVPGNYHRYVKADGRKMKRDESRMDMVREICGILSSQGHSGTSVSYIHQRMNDWIKRYEAARKQALDGKPYKTVKHTFAYYYDLVGAVETQRAVDSLTKIIINNNNHTATSQPMIETQSVASTLTKSINNNPSTNQHMIGGPSHASRIRQPIVISSSPVSDISDECSLDDRESLESIDDDHQPTDIIDISPPIQQQQPLTTIMKNVDSSINHNEEDQQEDDMEVVAGSGPTLANNQQQQQQQQRYDILQQQQQQHQHQQTSSYYQDVMEMQYHQYEMMERLIQQQQQQTLEQQARRDRMKHLRLRLSLLNRLTKAGSSKDEIAHHISQLQ